MSVLRKFLNEKHEILPCLGIELRLPEAEHKTFLTDLLFNASIDNGELLSFSGHKLQVKMLSVLIAMGYKDT
jgi:hypothetical protein